VPKNDTGLTALPLEDPPYLIGLGVLLLTNVSVMPEIPTWSITEAAPGMVVCVGLGERMVESKRSACSA
jgi:hypothetical protein